MAVSRTASCFLTYLTLSFFQVAGQSPKYALKGEKVNLNPTIPGQPDEILWKHNGSKVVEFDGAEEQVFGTFEGRVTLDWHSADLVIDSLRFEDSGEYELEAYINKRMDFSRYSLKVIDKVAKPTISCNMNNGNSSDISARLVCSAEPSESQSITKFEWISRGNVHPGPQLPISLGEERDDEVYTCSVSNPLSNETATFTAKDCYPVANAFVPVIASLVTIIFIILLGFGVWFCKQNQKACFAEGQRDLEKQKPPGATVPEEKAAQGDEAKPLLVPTTPDSDNENAQVEVETPRKEEKTVQGDKAWPPLDRAPTLPSEQRLYKFNSSLTPNDHAKNHKEHTDSDDENAQVEGETPRKELDKEAVEDEEAKSSPANGPSPTACPSSPLTANSPDVELEDTADEHKEDTNEDQVSGETAGENVGDNDSSGQEERDESEKSSEDEQSSTVLEQKGPETQHEQGSDLTHGETDTSKDNHQEIEKTVPAGEIESNSVSDHEVGEELDLYSATSPQPQNPTPAKADNTNTAHEDPDREEEGETSCVSENKELDDDRSTSPHNEAPIQAQDEEATLRRKGSVRDAVKRIEENNHKRTSAVKLQADHFRGLAEDEVAQSENETGPAGLLADCSKNLMSELESSTAAEEPESKKEPDEDDKAPSVPASPETSPTVQANSPLTKSSPNVPHKDTTGAESDSDQLTGETVRESDSPGIH